METRTRWGIVFVAGIFGVIAVGTAVGTFFFEKQKEEARLGVIEAAGPNDTDADGLMNWEELAWHTDPENPDTDGDGVGDGNEVLARTDPTVAGAGIDTYSAWGSTAPTAQLVGEIAIGQEALLATNATSDALDATANAIVDGIKKPDLEERIPISALKISTSTPLGTYAEVVMTILKQSVRVRSYEIATFSNTVSDKNTSGTPELKEAGAVYKKIESILLGMKVPQSVATEHLAVVNAIGTTANIVNAMAVWGGDPVAGFAYVDAFLAAEQGVEASVTGLFTKVEKLLPTS